jgi:hypothetical protein
MTQARRSDVAAHGQALGATLPSPFAPAKVSSLSYFADLARRALLTIRLLLKELTTGMSVAAWLVC